VVCKIPIRIATRQSALALQQANQVKTLLETTTKLTIKPILVPVTTSGDRLSSNQETNQQINQETQTRFPAHATGKGLFIKEVQETLLDNLGDLAVHSLKDLPWETIPGITALGVLPRQTPNDVLVWNPTWYPDISLGLGVQSLPQNQWWGVIKDALASKPSPWLLGTNSKRREHVLAQFPNATLTQLRGNVPTRLDKVLHNQVQATILAMAGLERLHLWNSHYMVQLPICDSIPAPGQGIVFVEASDRWLHRLKTGEVKNLHKLFCKTTTKQAIVERLVGSLLGAGCSQPVGVYTDLTTLHVFYKNTVTKHPMETAWLAVLDATVEDDTQFPWFQDKLFHVAHNTSIQAWVQNSLLPTI
jgi:hydroxymethylbilane synthase